MSSDQPDSKSLASNDLVIAEYTALREELLKLTDMQHQLIAIALVAFGALVGAGVQSTNTSIILTYPILAVFLASCWFNHAYGIDMLGDYIQKHIEDTVGTNNIGWENHSRKDSIPHAVIAFLAARGIFVVTQIIAIIIGTSRANFNIPLFIIALLCTIGSTLFLVGVAWAQKGRKRLIKSSHQRRIFN
jgi:hypothetical protein